MAHEHVDVNISALVWSIVVMFGGHRGHGSLMLLLFNWLASQAAARDPLSRWRCRHGDAADDDGVAIFSRRDRPKLMTDEPKRLNEVRTSEQLLLHAYGWTDEKAGVAHIPIDEAKKTDDQRGLVVQQDPLTDEHLGTRRPASGESSSGRNVTRTEPPAAPRRHLPAAARHAGALNERFRVQGSGVQGSGFEFRVRR